MSSNLSDTPTPNNDDADQQSITITLRTGDALLVEGGPATIEVQEKVGKVVKFRITTSPGATIKVVRNKLGRTPVRE